MSDCSSLYEKLHPAWGPSDLRAIFRHHHVLRLQLDAFRSYNAAVAIDFADPSRLLLIKGTGKEKESGSVNE